MEQLSEPAHCCNLLVVAVKYNANSVKLKFRPVLDLSRHVNIFIQSRNVQLDDLSHIAPFLEQGDHLLAFDIKNQFLQYFVGTLGKEQYYQFTVMVYVQVVTRFILPLKAYIRKLGIRFSIYVDDGRCAAASAELVYWQQKVVLHAFQLAGWNVNWEKTVMVPSKSLLYIGFLTDTNVMKYFPPATKILPFLANLLCTLLDLFMCDTVGVKIFALVLGKIVSMLMSHGSVLPVSTRAAQHILGRHVSNLHSCWNVYKSLTGNTYIWQRMA